MIADRLDIKYLVVAGIVFLLGNLIRAFRFKQLDHTDKKLIFWWNINSFYNFITATLPGGSGEAATAYVLKRYSMFNILVAVRILFLSRLLDIFALSALFLFAAININSHALYREVAIFISSAALLISIIALIPACEQFIMKRLQKLPGHFTFIKKLVERLNELLIIAKEHRDTSSFSITLVQSGLNMFAGFATFYLLVRSFGVDFTLVQSFYCYGIYAMFQIIPVQGIAGIGTQAAWFALALNVAGYRAQDAIALGFVLHGTFYLFIALIGVFSVLAWVKQRGER